MYIYTSEIIKFLAAKSWESVIMEVLLETNMVGFCGGWGLKIARRCYDFGRSYGDFQNHRLCVGSSK